MRSIAAMSISIDTAVRRARSHETARVASLLARAFYDDPVFTWFFAREHDRVARMERFFAKIVLEPSVLPHGRVDVLDDMSGAALWLAPGAPQPSLTDQLRLLPHAVRIYGRDTVRALRWAAALEKVHPHEPCWFLWFVGVESDRRGAGLGGDLMRPVLERCDADGALAYLEATSPRNRRLYERHGFEVAAEIQLPFGSPPFWAMWREPS